MFRCVFGEADLVCGVREVLSKEMTLNKILKKNIEMVNFMLYVFYHIKNRQ